LITLGAIQNDGLGLRDTRFQNIVAQVRDGGNLRLEDVATEIRAAWIGGDARFQNVFGQVCLAAGGAGGAHAAGFGVLTAAGAASLAAIAGRPCFIILEALKLRAFQEHAGHDSNNEYRNHVIDR